MVKSFEEGKLSIPNQVYIEQATPRQKKKKEKNTQILRDSNRENTIRVSRLHLPTIPSCHQPQEKTEKKKTEEKCM